MDSAGVGDGGCEMRIRHNFHFASECWQSRNRRLWGLPHAQQRQQRQQQRQQQLWTHFRFRLLRLNSPWKRICWWRQWKEKGTPTHTFNYHLLPLPLPLLYDPVLYKPPSSLSRRLQDLPTTYTFLHQCVQYNSTPALNWDLKYIIKYLSVV